MARDSRIVGVGRCYAANVHGQVTIGAESWATTRLGLVFLGHGGYSVVTAIGDVWRITRRGWQRWEDVSSGAAAAVVAQVTRGAQARAEQTRGGARRWRWWRRCSGSGRVRQVCRVRDYVQKGRSEYIVLGLLGRLCLFVAYHVLAAYGTRGMLYGRKRKNN